jgi:hypothetical protein
MTGAGQWPILSWLFIWRIQMEQATCQEKEKREADAISSRRLAISLLVKTVADRLTVNDSHKQMKNRIPGN